MPLDRFCNVIEAWHLRRLREYVNTSALAGDKDEHARAVKAAAEFHDMLRGETPELDDPDRFRDRWGTTDRAQEGQAAMLRMPGVAGFVLDAETADQPAEGPVVE